MISLILELIKHNDKNNFKLQNDPSKAIIFVID